MEEQQNIGARTVPFSLYQRHEEIIHDAMPAFHRKNRSDMLQFILEDWAKLKLYPAETTPTAPAKRSTTQRA